ncbi:MAG: universal stress protein [Deltaproteobacteria bacterium]|nr:universal stress protein [Deltaproteobacteria bacterium]
MAQEESACPLSRGERILVAVDGSVFSDAAVDQAISLAGVCNSQIFVISVVDLYPEQLEIAPALVDKVSEEVRQHTEKAKQKIDEANIPCETIVHMGGKPHKFIVEEAKKRAVDLIVMGTHGRTGFKRILMGSVAQNVIGHAPCPVLVVPTVTQRPE